MIGSEFNERYHDKYFIILLKKDYTDSDGYQYQVGLNTFAGDITIEQGFNFSHPYGLYWHLGRDDIFVSRVEIPDDAIVDSYDEFKFGFRTDKIIISHYVMINDFEIIGDNYALDAVKYDSDLLYFVKYKTPEICAMASASHY